MISNTSVDNSPDGFGYVQHYPNNYSRFVLVPKYSTAIKPVFEIKNVSSDSSLLVTTENAKMAGMKIFATIMLNAWRRRRSECKLLNGQVEKLKEVSMKAHNQIHVYNTLIRVEQRRNEELTCKLKRSMDNINEAKASCESLTTSLISLKADHSLLEEELRAKYDETENLNTLLAEAKSELYNAVVEQKALRASLVKEQRNKQFVENQKNKLITEVCEIGEENKEKEIKYCKELEKIGNELLEAKQKEFELLQEIKELKDKTLQMTKRQEEEDIMLRREVQILRVRCLVLKEELANSFTSHMKAYWCQFIKVRGIALEVAHVFSFCLLPATPKPPSVCLSKFPPWFKKI